jgi:hypothetical protein
MVGVVRSVEHGQPECRGSWNEDAAPVHGEAVNHGAGGADCAVLNLLALGDDLRQCGGFPAEPIKELKLRP